MFPAQNLQRHLTPALAAGILFTTLIAGTVQPAAAAGNESFNSPEQAANNLYRAVQTNDQSALARLIGPLGSSNDMVQDKADRQRFLEKYSEMHRLVKQPDGTTLLYIGAENWPFPVPLISSNGTWSFDVDAGSQEIMFRRVGEAETTAIETSRAIARAAATADIPTSDPAIGEYAKKMHGYQFRILRTPNGAVVLAYPSEYGVTGIMTFAATPDGSVYEKDLGPKTGAVAQAMVRYKRDRTWRSAEQ